MYSMYKNSLSIENYFSVDMYQKHKVASYKHAFVVQIIIWQEINYARHMTEWIEFVNIVTKIIM